MSTARAVPMDPPLGADAPRYRDATLLDSFGIMLPPDTPRDAERLARLALSEPPAIVRALMALRDGIMAPLGVQSSGHVRAARGDRPRIEFFPLLAASADEVELGLDDRHLDFRAWFTLDEMPGGLLLRSTTVARAHNRLGRIYLTVIRPFHVAIVRTALHRAARRLADPAWHARI